MATLLPLDNYPSSDDESYEVIDTPATSGSVLSVVEKKEETPVELRKKAAVSSEKESSPVPAQPAVPSVNKEPSPVPAQPAVPSVNKEPSPVPAQPAKRNQAQVDPLSLRKRKTPASLVAAFYPEHIAKIDKKAKEQEDRLTGDGMVLDLFTLTLAVFGAFVLGCGVLNTASTHLNKTAMPDASQEDAVRSQILLFEQFQPATPSSIAIDGFPTGHRIRIVGKSKPNAKRFSFDLEKGSDIGFHFNPRFYQSRVVRNHAVKGEWNFEAEEIHGHFPFKMEEIFTVEFVNVLYRGKAMIKVFINGKEFTNFPERNPSFVESTHLTIRGDVSIHSVQVFKN